MRKENAIRHILFVDDEPRILKGLQRMLRKMRHEWIMEFVQSGPEALELLAKKKYDVVVSDMRMPGMDGSQLLAKVQEDYPLTVRIVLSGQSDHESIMKSVRPAHRYLSKPCDPEILQSTISRACALRDLHKQDSLKRVISQTEFIPSLPSLYKEVMNELKSPDGSIEKVGKLIASDIGMTSKILQLVNSAFFGVPCHVTNPSQAVHLLGLDTVRALVLTIGLFSEFDNITLTKLNIEVIYTHSIKTGTLAKKIAKKEALDSELVDNSFMAGMLHDLGKLVLSANFPEIYHEVYELSKQENIQFHEAENEKIGVTHAEVGAYLLGLWGLPDSIVEGVAFHHSPENSLNYKFNPLTAVYAANILEKHCRKPIASEELLNFFDTDYLKKNDLLGKIQEWERCL